MAKGARSHVASIPESWPHGLKTFSASVLRPKSEHGGKKEAKGWGGTTPHGWALSPFSPIALAVNKKVTVNVSFLCALNFLLSESVSRDEVIK